MGGPTRTSADASVPRLAGFSLITLIIRGGGSELAVSPPWFRRSRAKNAV